MSTIVSLVAALAMTTTAAAQNALAAIEDGQQKIVKAIFSGKPQVVVDGKLRGTSALEFTFVKATVYRPGLVTLKNFRVTNSYAEVMDTGANINNRLLVSCDATATMACTHCFIVLEMLAWKTRGLVFAAMPDLQPGKTVNLDLNFPLSEHLDEGTYFIHLFSDGIELLHSKMSASYIAKQKQKTESLLSGKGQDFPAIAARTVRAVYPDELKPLRVRGSALVRCVVTKAGKAVSPEVVSASHPAFGEAAAAALAKWTFDPALSGRRIVESTIEIPFRFEMPE